jgi:hypothetical protein
MNLGIRQVTLIPLCTIIHWLPTESNEAHWKWVNTCHALPDISYSGTSTRMYTLAYIEMPTVGGNQLDTMEGMELLGVSSGAPAQEYNKL